MSIKCDFALVCDDVRREDNGKLIAVGIYGSDIQVSSFPRGLGLMVLARFAANEPGEYDFEIRIMDRRKRVAGGKGKLGINASGMHVFSLGPFLCEFEKATDINIQTRIGDGRFQSVLKLPIRLQPTQVNSNAS